MAPLAGYTDVPYRKSMRRHGCRFAFTEMVDAESLLHGTRKSLYYIDPDEPGEWLGIQLVSNIPDALKAAVPRLSAEHFSVIDFNLGCPAPKVAKKGEGAILARQNPDLAVRCTEALTAASKIIPVSVKMRILSETDPDITVQFAQRLEQAGIRSLTLHGRIMEKFYSGPVFFNILKAVRENVKIPVIANGGILDLQQYDEIRRESGCTEVMIARGSLGNPWIFNMLSQRETFQYPTVAEYIQELHQYLEEMCHYYGVELGLKIARKTTLDFLRGRGFSGEIKNTISKLSTRDDVAHLLESLREGPDAGYRVWSQHHSSPRSLRP